MSLAISSLGPDAIELTVEGKLDSADYKKFVPLAEERIKEHGGVSLLVRLSHLRGWTPAALWEDLKFDAKHFRDVPRLALVGEDSKKQQWLATLARPFTAADVEFYPESELQQARNWVVGGKTAH